MLRATVKLLKNTHRHPANRALHAVGLPIYVYGIALTVGHFAGTGTNVLLGLGLWASAVSMLVAGHTIEGNIGTMTPVLIGRFALRSFRHHRYLAKQRIHLLR